MSKKYYAVLDAETQENANTAIKNKQSARFKIFPDKISAQQHISIFSSLVYNETIEGPKSIIGEKPLPFKSPSVSEFSAFKQYFNKGEIDKCLEMINDNPRYLISYGDTPVIMQEGARYHILHLCARNCKAFSALLCASIIDFLGNNAFYAKLYPEDSLESLERRKMFLTDLYLNNPDKILCETPLHMASKFGNVSIVKLLIQHPLIDKTCLNINGQNCQQVVCERYQGIDKELISKQLSVMFEDPYYVPVIRPKLSKSSGDALLTPYVGKPFMPNSIEHQLDWEEIDALAGPMSLEKADSFYHVWRSHTKRKHLKKVMQHKNVSPNKTFNDSNHHNTFNNLNISLNNEADVFLRDVEKGLERVGRRLARLENVGWKEKWKFLQKQPANLTTKSSFFKIKDVSQSSLAVNTTDQGKIDSLEDLSSPLGLSKLQSFLKELTFQKWLQQRTSLSSNEIQESFTSQLFMNECPTTKNDTTKEYIFGQNSGLFTSFHDLSKVSRSKSMQSKTQHKHEPDYFESYSLNMWRDSVDIANNPTDSKIVMTKPEQGNFSMSGLEKDADALQNLCETFSHLSLQTNQLPTKPESHLNHLHDTQEALINTSPLKRDFGKLSLHHSSLEQRRDSSPSKKIHTSLNVESPLNNNKYNRNGESWLTKISYIPNLVTKYLLTSPAMIKNRAISHKIKKYDETSGTVSSDTDNYQTPPESPALLSNNDKMTHACFYASTPYANKATSRPQLLLDTSEQDDNDPKECVLFLSATNKPNKVDFDVYHYFATFFHEVVDGEKNGKLLHDPKCKINFDALTEQYPYIRKWFNDVQNYKAHHNGL